MIPAKPSAYSFPASSTALIMVGLHGTRNPLFLDDPGSLQPGIEPNIPKYSIILKAFRERNMPVFHVREPHSRVMSGNTPPKPPKQPETQNPGQHENVEENVIESGQVSSGKRNCYHLIDECAPKPWEMNFDMPGKETLWSATLHEQLIISGVTHLIIGGITTQGCAVVTSRGVHDRGFECCIFVDSITDYIDTPPNSSLEAEHWSRGLIGFSANLQDFVLQKIHAHAPDYKHVSATGDWNGYLDLLSLRQAYKSGVSPVAVIIDVYKRIETHLSKTSSTFIAIVPQAAAISTAQDLLLKYTDCASRPPLFGVPFSLKDNIDVAGMATTIGCPQLAYIPRVSAEIYTRLISLGAIFIGKTNMDQLATGMTGCRSPYGIPASVFNPLYIAGGSSSGAAVSVGEELVSFAVGTDTAGSGRVPAGFNGVVGWKPTKGTVSLSGVSKACESLDCIAFMTTRRGGVGDAREIWRYVRGYDPEDAYSKPPNACLPSRYLGAPRPSANKFRFAIPPQSVIAKCAPVFCQLFYESVAKLQAAGGELMEVDWAPFEEAGRLLYDGTLVNERLAAMPFSGKDWYEANKDSLHPVTREVFGSVLKRGNTAEDVFRDLKKTKMHALFSSSRIRFYIFNPFHASGIDVLVVPTTPNHFTTEEVLKDPVSLNSDLGAFAHFGNVLDLCAVAMPAGTYGLVGDDGKQMPFSITLLAGSGDDARLLDLAALFEKSAAGALG
ncbi:amidase signature domain-containing protein [Morchella snyderi]|nr:amidase signature domain-containing protein [Morchella snyderi]